MHLQRCFIARPAADSAASRKKEQRRRLCFLGKRNFHVPSNRRRKLPHRDGREGIYERQRVLASPRAYKGVRRLFGGFLTNFALASWFHQFCASHFPGSFHCHQSNPSSSGGNSD